MQFSGLLGLAWRRAQAFRLENTNTRALYRMNRDQLRDIGLCEDDLIAIDTGAYFCDPTRHRANAIAQPTAPRLAWIHRELPGIQAFKSCTGTSTQL